MEPYKRKTKTVKVPIDVIVEDWGVLGWLAYVPKDNKYFKGCIVQGETEKEVKEEIIKSLQIKISYDSGNK